ncbi:MAG: Mbeg1-like protein [Christensenellales bacterium]
MFVDETTRARIQTVYNFDGPGFNEATISSEAFGKVDMRIRTFVPQSSMIGILMWHREPFTIVRSNGVGVFQHDAYTSADFGRRIHDADRAHGGTATLPTTRSSAGSKNSAPTCGDRPSTAFTRCSAHRAA